MSKLSKKDLHSIPGVASKRDTATQGFLLQQTMLRIKDPVVSLDFYTRVCGMTLLCKLDYKDMAFSLYFLGYVDPAEIPEDPVERARWMFGLPGCLELTHNWGTENDPEFQGYHNGNDGPRGFGHIGLSVPSVEAACKRFDDLNVEFVKRPNDGKMRNLAFIKDPDGYWIEILEPGNAPALVNWAGNDE
ncbi:hypothetical protein Ndes2526B_g02543 [Nannochloris sp. 'desiccata']|nr:hypothetical protein KSW81_007156 [Chlorella desiccata (nom. nud.)]KAH7621728.1 putative Lactoylglutathione lyase [Chlorella desiccata (nom. nud.)]